MKVWAALHHSDPSSILRTLPARWSATFRLYQSRRFAPIVARPLEANGQTNSIQIRLHLQEGAGASARSGDRPFELDLAREAVTIAPDRQNRQLAAAMPVSHGAVLRLESAVYVDPIPLPGVADVVEQQVVLLGPEERNSVEALARAEHVAGRRLALAFGDDPMLDADALAGQPVRPTGDVACSIDARNSGLQI